MYTQLVDLLIQHCEKVIEVPDFCLSMGWDRAMMIPVEVALDNKCQPRWSSFEMRWGKVRISYAHSLSVLIPGRLHQELAV